MFIKASKLKKNKEELKKYITKKVAKYYFTFIEDFCDLAFKNDWQWYGKEITPDVVFKSLVDDILHLLQHHYDSYSSGRILITKYVDTEGVEIEVAISYS
jgi:hypothetical protein